MNIGQKILKFRKEFLAQKYSATGQNNDVFVAFIENTLDVVRQSGNFGYIVPLAWQTGVNYSDLQHKLLSAATLLHVVNLPFDVFPDAYVDVGIVIVRDENPKPDWKVTAFAFPKTAKVSDLDTLNHHKTPQSQWATGRGTIVVDPARLTLLKRLEDGASTVLLGSLTESAHGILAREQDIASQARGQNWKLFFSGEMDRYELDAPSSFVRYGENLPERPASFDLFVGQRLLVRRLVNRQDRLMASAAEETFVNKKDIYVFKPTSKEWSIHFLLSLINSQLLSFVYLEQDAAATKDDFRQTTLDGLRHLAIRRIDFATSAADRKRQLQQLVSQYQAALETLAGAKTENFKPNVLAECLATVGDLGSSLRIPADVLHDLLAYLAEQMTELNKQKQAESKRFLGWLEKELKIQPDKNGNTGIEALPGKTTLKNYLGDYQKDEEHTSFEALWEVLRRNTRRLRHTLDAAFDQRMRQEYEKSLALLLPTKQKLAATDWLIDQLVYRLYGLTEEEIAIVEETMGRRQASPLRLNDRTMSSDIHPRRSMRLQGYDYAQAGPYLVTICVQNRECLLGEVANGKMMLNGAGQMVEAAWDSLPNRFPFIELDQFCIMPNHVHGIIVLAGHRSAQGGHPPHALGDHKDRPYNPSRPGDSRGESCIRPTSGYHPSTPGDHKDRPYSTSTTGGHQEAPMTTERDLQALEGLPTSVLEQVKDFIIFLKETKVSQRPPLKEEALAKKRREAIKKWAGTNLGPGFSGREHDAILYKT